jgi:hypothetical protein
VKCGDRIARALEDALAVTCLAVTVLQTQIEYVTVPPAVVLELCCTSWAVTQSAPAWCERLGEGDGLGECERDGDGLGEPDFDGLVLVLLDGLGLSLGLREALELRDGLGLGELLADFDGLALADGEELCEASSLAEATATEPRPHGEPAGWPAEASAGAIAKPETRKDPATSAMAARPARMTPTGTTALRSSGRPGPVLLLPRLL